MQKKQLIYTSLIALLVSIITFAVAKNVGNRSLSYNTDYPSNTANPQVSFASYSPSTGPSFESAAAEAIPAVVHINVATSGRTVSRPSMDPFDFFGGREYYQGPSVGSGSGVIINPDGYIVTNNHVVSDADKILVTLSNGQEYQADLIGTDPSTDIAVIKIAGKNFPTLKFANSDNVQIGQWVLAVGYPLNLDATVTAGIVSAKSRNIGINQRQSENAIESFIQTDAAVNPGNSGGALVDVQGNLIGINSAIASPTGSYAGYSYAIPSNIASKIVKDIIQYGEAKRGYIGVAYIPLSPQVNSELKIPDSQKGIYVREVLDGGAAQKAGLKEGDIITSIDGTPVNTDPVFREKVATMEQGQPVTLTVLRNGSPKTLRVTPSANIGKSANAKTPSQAAPSRGSRKSSGNTKWFDNVELETLSPAECKKLGIQGGVKILNPGNDSRLGSMVDEGFIITEMNGKKISNADQVVDMAENSSSLELSGQYENRPGNFYIQIR